MGASGTRRQKWNQRLVLIICTSGVVILIVAWIGTAWYFSDQIIKPAHGPATFPETVEKVTTSSQGVQVVSLLRSPATSRPGRYGLVWQGGNAMLGKILFETPSRIDRIVLSGSLPPAGARAGMSGTYSPDPKTALGLNFSEVIVPTELGAAPAWFIPTDTKSQAALPGGTWAITVHGSSADRKQSLKFVPVLHRAGLSVLDISYRNDIGAPRSPDGLMHLGESEWRDLDAAVRFALSKGARHIVLYGGSMGGAIVLQFLTNSSNADRISAVLLEAPMLCVPRMIDYLGQIHHMPALETWSALQLTNWRLGFDVHRIDVLQFPIKVHPPTLVLQDLKDEVMPLTVARAFVSSSARNGWPIRYAEFPNAGHGEAWNSDAERCEGLISAFLRTTLPECK